MSGVYEKQGLRFQYPENWQLAEEDSRSEPRTVTVQNESGAFWSVAVYLRRREAAELASLALAALREEYNEIEAEPVAEDIDDVEAVGYEAHFFVQQLLAAARIRVFPLGSGTCVVLCQAEDREFDRLDAVFQAITTSLIREK